MADNLNALRQEKKTCTLENVRMVYGNYPIRWPNRKVDFRRRIQMARADQIWF